MLNLDEFKFSMSVRCFKSSEGYQIFGPFYPQYVKAITIHDSKGVLTKTVISGGDSICSPIIKNSTPQQIVDAINETWENDFNKNNNVEALIAYQSDDWNSVRVMVIEFPSKIESDIK